jgi:hypothetical protein
MFRPQSLAINREIVLFFPCAQFIRQLAFDIYAAYIKKHDLPEDGQGLETETCRNNN